MAYFFKYLAPLTLTEVGIRFFAVLSSIAISVLIFSYNQPLNTDGILYLSCAKAYLQHGLHAAMVVYPWPFYSILIAYTSRLLHIPLLHAAYILNTGFIALTVWRFIQLSQELGGNRTVQLFAAIVILLFPALNNLRDAVIRDFGYYFFALTAVFYLLRYMNKPTWLYAMAWGVSILLATLFRIEGIIFQCLAACVLLLRENTSLQGRIVYVLKAQSINILLFLGLFLWFFLSAHGNSASLGRLIQVKHEIVYGLHSIATVWHANVAAIKPVFGANTASFIVGGLIGIFVYIFVKALTPVYGLLVCYTTYYRLLPMNNAYRVLLVFNSLNLLILILFLLQNRFLTGRFMMFLNLTLLLAVPFALADILAHWRQKITTWRGSRLLFPSVCALLFVMAIASLLQMGPSKAYIVQAGRWLNAHTPQNSRIFINSSLMLFYVDRQDMPYPQDFSFGNTLIPYQKLSKLNREKFNYFAILVRHKNIAKAEKLFAELHLKPIKQFQNNWQDRIFILKVSEK